MTYSREDSDFYSYGLRCAGWLYMPKGAKNPPVVVMAHGFAAERTFRLPAFAEKFVDLGMAVFLFDYRNFGDSEGEPRNFVSPSRHVADWKVAIEHVRSIKKINSSKMALWGSSFSGGHVIMVAAEDRSISAIVAQVPFVDGLYNAQGMKPAFMARMLAAGLKDLARAAVDKPPHCIKVVGEPHELAAMNRPGNMDAYTNLVPPESKWKNECPARIVFSISTYRPSKKAHDVKCPALIVIAENDNLIPASIVRKTAEKMPDATVISYPIGHFEIYVGEYFEKASTVEAIFLKNKLL